MSAAKRTPNTGDEGGLRVERSGLGWEVVHAPTGMRLGPRLGGLRQRRFAEELKSELLRTGTDFTRDPGSVREHVSRWLPVTERWAERADRTDIDPRTFEYYSPRTPYGQFIPSAEAARELRANPGLLSRRLREHGERLHSARGDDDERRSARPSQARLQQSARSGR